jgi:hypothetical protein
MRLLNHFRHPALAFWVVACLVLGGVLGWSQYTGKHSPQASIRREPVAQDGVVFSLRTELSTLLSVAQGPNSSIAAVADKTTAMALKASHDYRAGGGGASDSINQGYLHLANDGGALASAASANSANVGALESQVLADGDVLVGLLPLIGADQFNNPGLP